MTVFPPDCCPTLPEVAQPVCLSVCWCLCHCRVGEGRAYWSLGNAHTALGNHQQAMYFAEKHLEIAKEVCAEGLTSSLRGRMRAAVSLRLHLLAISRTAWSIVIVKTVDMLNGTWPQALVNDCTYLFFQTLKTGDKSGEETARMNLSDLRLVVGLKSNSNINPNVFCNINSNSSVLPVSYQGYINLPGKRDLFKCVSIFTCINSVHLKK